MTSVPASLISPHDQRATFIELFFDLVFVFSVTQVVVLLHDGLTWGRAAEATLVFWIVWWAWTQFTWALNAANTDHPRVQLGTLLATAVAFFMAVSVPGAFGDRALWFAIPYVIVRGIGLVVYDWVAEDDEHRRAIRMFAMASISGLIMIIALGESLIVAAAGLAGVSLTVDVVTVAALAVVLTCGLWWTYFPYLRPALEHAMAGAPGDRQAGLARDAYSFWHFPLLCGVIGIAAGIEEAILHPGDPLPADWRAALALGLFLFFLGSGLATWRAMGKTPTARLAIGVLIAGLVYGFGALPPAASLGNAIVGIAAIAMVEQKSMHTMR